MTFYKLKKTNSPKIPDTNTPLIDRLIIGIGEVSEITGVSARQLRYWESKGIIGSANSTICSNRKYDYASIEKIIFIKNLLDEGYTLEAAAKKLEERLARTGSILEQMEQATPRWVDSSGEFGNGIDNTIGSRRIIDGKEYLCIGIANYLPANEQIMILLPEDKNLTQLIADHIDL
ncbi:MAG: MerR family transcriptional regulator [Clostridiaceae bacterium]|jgi:DNA-binding transcriptional MerR regulator|nr:MerR family transcriptional regulator [Clostridiaceae bacterium]